MSARALTSHDIWVARSTSTVVTVPGLTQPKLAWHQENSGPVWTAMGQNHEPFAPACETLSPAKLGDWADVFRQAAARVTAFQKITP